MRLKENILRQEEKICWEIKRFGRTRGNAMWTFSSFIRIVYEIMLVYLCSRNRKDMKKTITFAFLTAFALHGMGETIPTSAIPSDTSRTVLLDEAIVQVSSKLTSPLRKQAVSVSAVDKEILNQPSTQTLSDVAKWMPNFYMPKYGSRLTAATYVRGVGTRSGTPAVGLYIDNMPVLEKSAFDYHFIDVERVSLLRGPQSTLYGANAMGGLLLITSADPFRHQGTELRLGVGTRGHQRVAVHNSSLLSERLALSVGGFVDKNSGNYSNASTNESADRQSELGFKANIAYRPSDRWRMDLSMSCEYNDEHSNPYFLLSPSSFTNAAGATTVLPVDAISQNRQSNYRRTLFNTGLNLKRNGSKTVFHSVTAFQLLDDRLFMDQDFTQLDMFSLEQQQRMHGISQEFTLKSRGDGRWQWTTGVYGNYRAMTTDCPVNFYSDGVDYINGMFSGIFATVPYGMSLAIDGPFAFDASLRTPTVNAAVFHQSTLRDLFVKGLSLTLGLRLDYDAQHLNMSSAAVSPIGYTYRMSMGPTMSINAALNSTCAYSGEMNNEVWQLLPKAALQYDFDRDGRNNVYAVVSKGYRSGGYNIQSYSDLSQSLMRREMMLGVQNYVTTYFANIPAMPAGVKTMIVNNMTNAMAPYLPDEPQVDQLKYDAETSWNFEAGTHLSLFNDALEVDASAFMIQTRNQQLAKFAASGMGRILVNTGESMSCGGEFSARLHLLNERLNVNASYGYTHAVFKNYDLGLSNGTAVDYTDNRIPYVPEQTANIGVTYRQPVRTTWLKSVGISGDWQALGRIYWDEANTMSEGFSAQFGAHVDFEFSNGINLKFWGENLGDRKIKTFQFVSMNRTFAQYGAPRVVGIDLGIHF